MGQMPPRVAVLVIGIGTVGGTLIEQVLAGRERWKSQLGMDLMVGAVAGLGGATAPDAELGDETLRSLVADRRSGTPISGAARDAGLDLHPIETVITALAATGPLVVVDAAAGDRTTDVDALALQRGGGVVLSNKAPMAMPMDHPSGKILWEEAGAGGRLRYEATCGAGLPVFSTLRALLDTGDEVREIQGAVSGTLGAIFADLAAGTTFSAAVRSAMENGFTEPDPRDDLSGLDVARKALILARTLGVATDLDDIQVEGLVPDELSSGAGVDVRGFLERMGELDDDLGIRAKDASGEGRSLRYVATVTPTEPPRVGINAVPVASALGSLRGPENAFTIRTSRYDAFPLSISGPGAGAAVTAAGMLADVLALATGPLAS